MIKIHRWKCLDCGKLWYLKVDDLVQFSLQQLDNYEVNVSIHVMETSHEVQHIEKGDTIFKYV